MKADNSLAEKLILLYKEVEIKAPSLEGKEYERAVGELTGLSKAIQITCIHPERSRVYHTDVSFCILCGERIPETNT